MKTTSTLNQIFRTIPAALIISIAFLPAGVSGQNLIKNGELSSGNSNWNYNGMAVEINAEKVYGGKGNNAVAEIDKQVGLRQQVEICRGNTYALAFDATRRTGGGTIAHPGMTVKIIGAASGTNYVNESKTFSNTSYVYYPQAYTFTIPLNSTDTKVIVEITAYNNNTTLGVIVDNFSFMQTSSLPVTFEMVKGSIASGLASITWTTSYELNNAGFTIEHSSNGQQFEAIGTVAAGQQARNAYSFRDAVVRNGVHYYRIRQNDLDGHVQYSTIIVLNFASPGSGLQAYPVPARNQLNLKINVTQAGPVNVVLFDMNGRPVMTRQIMMSQGMNLQAIDISALHPGQYVVKVSGEAFSASVGIVKG